MTLIRKYQDADKLSVRALFIRVNRELAPAYLRRQFESYIKRALRDEIDQIPAYYGERDGSFWIAESSGELVGMYGLERTSPGAAELRRMYVAPEARGQGIARSMLEHAEHICRSIGIDVLQLSTSELQVAALALYRASGYQLTSEEVATARTNKTLGSGLRRFHFEKKLANHSSHDKRDSQ